MIHGTFAHGKFMIGVVRAVSVITAQCHTYVQTTDRRMQFVYVHRVIGLLSSFLFLKLPERKSIDMVAYIGPL
jgi:hypothetical protein